MPRYRATFDGERRTASVGVKLTPTERQRLEAQAARSGVALSDYVRDLCLRRGVPKRAELRPNPDAKRLADELRAIGNNVNQLARVANQTGELRHETTLEGTLDVLKAAIARVIAL